MGALTEELREFLDANRVGVIARLASDGQPRQSLVYFARDGERLLTRGRFMLPRAVDAVRGVVPV